MTRMYLQGLESVFLDRMIRVFAVIDAELDMVFLAAKAVRMEVLLQKCVTLFPHYNTSGQKFGHLRYDP